MKHILMLFLAAIFMISCDSGVEGTGNVQKQNRDVKDFDEIDVSGNFEVIISQGETPSVAVEADANLLEVIVTRVNGNKLEIKSKRPIRDYSSMKVYVSMRKISEIEASGACKIISVDELRSEKMEIDLSGASEADLALRCDKLNIDMSGACKITLRGAGQDMAVDASGSCTIKAFDFRTANCKLDMSGAGKADVYVSNKLSVDVSGAAEIRYKGNPQDISQESSGASSISAYKN